MSTFDEVIAAAQANIASLDEAWAGIESTKAMAQQTQQQAAMLGADRLAHGAQGMTDSCAQAQHQTDPAKEKLQEVIREVQNLKAYEPGGGGGGSGAASAGHPTVATQHSDGTPLPEPDGEKLSGEPELKRRGEGLAGFFARKGEDVKDVLETAGKQIDIAWESVGSEPPPTAASMRTGSEVPQSPMIVPQAAETPKAGSALMAGFVVATIMVKSTQKASAAIRKSPKVEGHGKK